ncbi:o-methyltransferase [Desulfonema ishimotonii]|uniref:O-methyltransferase n=2 Tax=Desulfonema ishimotonii TaxID=45657 RepID=A0A401FUN0_9BACT|nr:o-methyltransferase [Desulfonema ishimotonii]
MPNPIDSEQVLQMSRGFWTSRLILTAAELDLFDRLPASAEEVADGAGWDTGALTVLLDALTALQLIEKQDEIYSVAPSIAPGLGKDPDASVLPMIGHYNSLWDKWSQLSHIIRNGREQVQFVFNRDETALQAFIGGMHVVGRETACKIISDLKPAWAGRLLDVGGASGTYALEFLKQVPGLSVTLFDLPGVIPMAEARIARAGAADRVRFVPGDFYHDTLPGGHDLVWLSAIIHQNSREQNRELFRKAHAALVPGGRIWIRDHIMDAARVHPSAGAVFAVNMLVATPGGSTYTFDEVVSDLASSGFTTPRMIRDGGQMDAVLEAVRP